MKMEETKKSSDSPSTTSFSSLPYDLVLNCLARISSIHRPTLSLVSKNFRSLLASGELEATRSHMGKTIYDDLYVSLDLNENKPNPRWFALAPIPKQQKLVPIPSFPYQLPELSTAVSTDSEIYIIGGFINEDICTSVFVLDSPSRRWRILPQMHVPRATPAADIIDGKLYVIGGCSKYTTIEHWGEVYDPKKQTWELFSSTGLDLTNQESVVRDRLVMSGKVYAKDGFEVNYQKHICLVEIDKNVLCQIVVSCGKLYWRDAKEKLGWSRLKQLYPNSNFRKDLVSVAKSCGGRRVTVWWKEVKFCRKGRYRNQVSKTEIWCAEISLQICSFQKLHGVVEWSKNVFTLYGSQTRANKFYFSFFEREF